VGIVQAQANMSLDGYVAKQDSTIGRLFDWLQNGSVAIPTPAGDFTVHLTPPNAEHWRRWVPSLGAIVCGRTLFDVAEGWQGRHTLDVPVVVVTHRIPMSWVNAHPDAPFFFVTDGWTPRSNRPRNSPATGSSPSLGEPSPGNAWTWGCWTR
jgi:hypothetical protein